MNDGEEEGEEKEEEEEGSGEARIRQLEVAVGRHREGIGKEKGRAMGASGGKVEWRERATDGMRLCLCCLSFCLLLQVLSYLEATSWCVGVYVRVCGVCTCVSLSGAWVCR